MIIKNIINKNCLNIKDIIHKKIIKLKKIVNIQDNNKTIMQFINIDEKDINYKKILKIQKFIKCKSKNLNIYYKIKALFEIFNLNILRMQVLLFESNKICKIFPLKKDINKMIYGKLIEKSINNLLLDLNINCIDLDSNCDFNKNGSNYKNDINIFRTNISIKAKLNKTGNIILINKKNKNIHNIDMHLLLFIINEKKLYFIPNYLLTIDNNKYIKNTFGSIEFKSSLITYINNYKKQYIYNIPSISEEQSKKNLNINEIEYIEDIYQKYIK